jgi:hypothetical protein
MDPRTSLPQVSLHLTSLAILSPANAPLYVRSFTGEQDELRHYHLAHAAVDVIEERSKSGHVSPFKMIAWYDTGIHLIDGIDIYSRHDEYTD